MADSEDKPIPEAPQKISDDMQNGQYASNKGIVTDAFLRGELMRIEPKHAENYDELKADAAKKGRTDVEMMVDTTDRQSYPVVTYPTGEGKATLVLQPGAIKATPAFETDFTEHQVGYGNYTVLTDELAANRAQLADTAKAAGYSKPALVVLTDTHDEKSPAFSKVVPSSNPNDPPMVVANLNAVETTQAFARQYMLNSDAFIAARVANGDLIPAAEAGVKPEVIDHFNSITSRNGQPPAKLYLDAQSSEIISQAEVKTTKEGNPVVFINQALSEYPVEAQRGAIDHENGHLVNGDATAQGRSDAHNKMRLAPDQNSIRRAYEEAADKTGILQSGNPQQAARDMVVMHTLDSSAVAQFLMKKNPSMTLQQAYDKALNTSDTHPSDSDRIYNAKVTASEISQPLDTPAKSGAVRER